MIADLDSERFAVRDEGRKVLEEMGEPALEALQRCFNHLMPGENGHPRIGAESL
jgi:hypothetical protein